MPATACSADLRRRRHCAAQLRARRAPVAAGRARCAGQSAGVPTRSASTSRSPKSRGGRLRSARRNARRSWRSDTGSTRPMGPVSRSRAWSPSSPSAAAASTVSIARAAGCRPAARPAVAVTTGTPAAVMARASAAPRLPHRADDHGHLRPRHAVDEVGPPQRVDDQRRFGVRRRGDPHGHRTRLCPLAHQFTGLSRAGQPPRDPAMASATAGCAAVRLGQRDHLIASSPCNSAGSAPR